MKKESFAKNVNFFDHLKIVSDIPLQDLNTLPEIPHLDSISDTSFFNIQTAVVRIKTSALTQSYSHPWENPKIGYLGVRGTGFSIQHEGKICILTNAHVVTDTGYIEIEIPQYDDKIFKAKVIKIDHTSDLAVLECEDPKFQEFATPLGISEKQNFEIGKDVIIYGFPQGKKHCVGSKGNISGIRFNAYSEAIGGGSTRLLSGQFSGKAQPGNSGSPILDKENKVIGVSFQGPKFDLDYQKMNYFIPVPVIQHFLKYGTFHHIDITYQSLESPSLRKHFKIPENISGLLIRHISPHSSAHNNLMSGDCLHKINGYQISNQGNIKHPFLPKNVPINFLWEVAITPPNGKVMFEVYRNNELITIQVPHTHEYKKTSLIKTEYNKKPDYLIVGGLVIQRKTTNSNLPRTALSCIKESMEEISGRFENDCSSLYAPKKTTDTPKNTYIIGSMLPYVEKGYEDCTKSGIYSVNGKEITNTQSLIEAFESNTEELHLIETSIGKIIAVLNNKEADLEACKKFHIPSLYSENWSKKYADLIKENDHVENLEYRV